MTGPGPNEYEAQLGQLVTGALSMLKEGVTSEVAVERPTTVSPATAEAPETAGPFHIAAAVLSTFDRSTLRPAVDEAPTEEPEDDLVDLLSDSTPVREGGTSKWKLLTDVRRELLQRLGNTAAIQRALEANPERPQDDPVQAMFEEYVRGTAPPLDKQTTVQLAASFEVAQWLVGLQLRLGSTVPDLESIRSRTDYLTLLQPFEDLAGDNFAGRTTELRELREYVGVLPPGTVKSRFRRAARQIFNLADQPPIVIHGPGGVGKSALVARFILEHALLAEEERFPFVYLDFDRASVRAEEPLTLLIEAVRQVGLQYPDARVYSDRIRTAWQNDLLERRERGRADMSAQSAVGHDLSAAPYDIAELEGCVNDFASLLGNIQEGREPCLFVLDTFEEVQYRGEAVVAGLCSFLQVFQQAVPRLRIVFASRVPLMLPDLPTRARPLGDFDQDAALQFLGNRGVTDEDLAKKIIKLIGRSPLSLLLAATVVTRARESGETDEFDFKVAARLTEADIQGMLYRRILEHVKDDEVAALAYPGLVLRRVTPDIIRHVLARACDVVVRDDAAAEDLFARLAKEVSLVSFEDDALIHRRDVRRMMLPLLRKAEAATVRKIDDAATTYYASRESAVERAEEIYHRLARHQPLDTVAERWTDNVRPYLFNALEENELGARERAWLLPRLDPSRKLTDEERAAADLETWEWDTETKVRQLVERNRLQAALDALRARTERSPASPLYLLEVDVLERMERWTDARSVVDAGCESAGEGGDKSLVVDLLTRAGTTDIRLGELASAAKELDEADKLVSDRVDDAPRALRISLARLELVRRGATVEPSLPDATADVKARFEQVTPEQLIADGALAAWTAADIGAAAPDVLRRVIDFIGLQPRPRQLRTLARALAEWDDSASRAENRWKGRLGGEALPWAETLTQSWTQHLRDLPVAALGPRISELLGRREPSPDVLVALESLMVDQAAAVILRPAVQQVATARPSARSVDAQLLGDQYAAVPLKLSGKEARRLQEALVGAFSSRDDLAAMVRIRLGRSLDSIALTENLDETVFALIQLSKVQGWTASLLAAAIDSRPDNPSLREVAELFGLVAAAPVETLEAQGAEPGGFVDLAYWRSQLGRLEAQVCRVSVGDAVYGTGFLVAADLILTASPVVQPVVAGELPPSSISAVFDFKSLPKDGPVDLGTTYALREDEWLVGSDHAEGPNGLAYALLHVAGTPGNDPIGGDRAEPGAPTRGWITPPRRSSGFMSGSPILILHHANGGPLRVAVSAQGLIGLNEAGTRVRYKTDTAPGSAGAPCFDVNWELLAIHQGSDASGVNEGVPISMIVRHLDETGVLPSVYRATV
jgi:hypothetical protein